MRKFLYILTGLVLVATAVSLAGYRHVWEPKTRAARTPDASIATRSAARTEAARPTPSAPSSARDRVSAPTTTKVDSIANFATVIDILNVVVGIVGIFLAIQGMRMQRQAMAMQAGRANVDRS